MYQIQPVAEIDNLEAKVVLPADRRHLISYRGFVPQFGRSETHPHWSVTQAGPGEAPNLGKMSPLVHPFIGHEERNDKELVLAPI